MVINGDKPILRLEGDRIVGYGTPWAGKEGMNRNTRVEVKAVIVLERDRDNHIEAVRVRDILENLQRAIYLPKDSRGLIRAVTMLGKITDHVRYYRLGCNMDPDSARVAYEGMHKKV